MRTVELAARLGKVTRTRPIAVDLLRDDAPFRQYVALDGEEIVGRVRSMDAVGATWCSCIRVWDMSRIGTLLMFAPRKDSALGDRPRGPGGCQ